MSYPEPSLRSATADPGAIGLSLFGFALFVYGVQFVAYAGAAPGTATSDLAAKPRLPPSVNELRVSGAFAFLAAAALWYRAAGIVLAIGRSPADQATAPAPASMSSSVTPN